MTATHHAPSPPHAPAPTASGGRLRPLDVLRGIAILGTLGTNIFVWISTPQLEGRAPGAASGTDLAVFEQVLMQLTNGKFLALLTLMFGIGLTIQFDAADRREQRWPHVYLWRGVLLFLDGLLHYLLVFEFDVLMAYSVTGMVVAYILLTSRRVQRLILGIAAAVHVTLLTLPVFGIPLPFLGTYGQVSSFGDRRTGGGELDAARLQELLARFGERGAAPGSDSWWSGVVGRWETFWGGREEAIFIIPMAIALFLVGSMLFRGGLFEERGRVVRRWLMGIGALAFVYDVLSVVFPAIAAPGNFGRYFVPIFIAPGIAAAVAAFYQAHRIGWFGRRLEDVGRLALSTYVGQNIVSMLLFSPWGLDLDAKLPAEWGFGAAVVCYLLVAVIIVAFATLWRRRFAQGPLEWLWGVSYRGAMRLTPSWGRPRAGAVATASSRVTTDADTAPPGTR